MKKWFSLMLTLVLLFSLLPDRAPAEEDAFVPLKVRSKGEEVLRLKTRLKELGYIRSSSLTKTYNDSTAKAVREFQKTNGLPETGETDSRTWALLFSDRALRVVHPTMKPLATPAPLPEVPWPVRDAEGFLAPDAGDEFFYENDTAGLWIYLGPRLQITITHRADSSIPLEWFETEIITRDGEAFRAAVTDPEHPGKNLRHPYAISRDEKFVLSFSDDFFANRVRSKETVGIIIREGRLFSSKTNKNEGHHLPNLDMIAQFPDGRLEVFRCNEITADELMALGVRNVYSFGPILIRDGVINELVYDYYKSAEPRQALGMIAPNHYFLLSVQGRNSDSKGTTLQRVAEIMKGHGVVQALNLDGGNTMALVFRGRMLNKLAVYKNRKFVRSVTSMIGIGETDNQSEE